MPDWLDVFRPRGSRRHRAGPQVGAYKELESWYQTAFGQYLLQRERAVINSVLPAAGAHRFMQLGLCPGLLLPENSAHLHEFVIATGTSSPGICGAIADFDALPLPSETIDTVLLHHALEFSQSPHDVLKEAARVLCPGGHIVLTVFNPFSFFGVTKWSGKLMSGQAIWQHHTLRHRRVLDWLRLLGFQLVSSTSGCYTLPLQWQRGLDQLQAVEKLGSKAKLPCGAFYVLVARKNVSKPIPVGRVLWQPIRIPGVPAVKKKALATELNREQEIDC